MADKLEIYFDDPRLEMTVLGRFLIRFSFYVGYFVVGALAFSLVLANNHSAFWLGILLVFFIIDRVFHIGEGEDSLLFLPKSGRYNIARNLSARSYGILESSLDKSLLGREDFRFLLLAQLIKRKEIEVVLTRLEIKKEDFLVQIEREFRENPLNNKAEILTLITNLVTQAFGESYLNRDKFIEPKDLLAALFALNDPRLGRIFSMFSIGKNDISAAVLFSHTEGGFLHRLLNPREASGAYDYRLRHRIMNRAWTARPTPFLDQFSTDLTDEARSGFVGFLVGHEKEYDRLMDILARPERPIALLMGDPGVGKETIIEHLAYNIVKDDVPASLFDKRLVSLSIGSLVAGATGGELQARVLKIMNEIILAGNIILYIPDISNLIKTSGGQFLSVADVMIPIIRKGVFPVIGATYPREFKKYIVENSDFVSVFETIKVEEVDEATASRILTFLSLGYEKEYHTIVTLSAINKCVTLSHKYFREKPLPQSAIDLMKEALAEAVRLKEKSLDANLVVSIAERKVNIPIHEVSRGEAETLLNLEATIHRRLIDQEEAVKAVSQAFREYRSGLTRKGGPIASFLFVGPTGVGKTELSKILADIQFGSEKMMTRFDMSEYQDKQSFYRFIGSPDGTISGALTDAILEKPYSIILLDEFEKAYPDILNLFLQVLDDGRLTDNSGRVADFQNAVIVATSNANSVFIEKSLGEGMAFETLSAELKKNLSDYFKPELINRFSGIIVFRPLSPEDTKKIAALQLNVLSQDLLNAQNVALEFDPAVIQKIGELGFNKTFGARPLRGVISEKLRGPIAEKILRGEIVKNDKIRLELKDGEFDFVKEAS